MWVTFWCTQIPASLMKRNYKAAVQIHGYNLPQGSLFLLDSHSLQNDPTLVEEVQTFMPERWLQDAKDKRKGTPAELIDHALYRDPFSWGTRRCPGKRIAQLELAVMVSQLVRDWKVELEDTTITLNDVTHFFGETCQPKVPLLKFTPR